MVPSAISRPFINISKHYLTANSTTLENKAFENGSAVMTTDAQPVSFSS